MIQNPPLQWVNFLGSEHTQPYLKRNVAAG
jgi:hypothetical protein